MAVAVVTSNPGKFREIRRILAESGVASRPVRRELPEIQADELEPVVRAKLSALGRTRGWAVVDDSGLFIHSLRGFPGVYSAYALRALGFEPILEWLNGRRRDAVFRTVAGFKRGSEVRLFSGETRGWIALRPRGRGGFGFDPIFVPEGETRTYAQLSPTEKDALSHRARALRAGIAELGARLTRG
jgi:XTP/dITP diphosphohydrolase